MQLSLHRTTTRAINCIAFRPLLNATTRFFRFSFESGDYVAIAYFNFTNVSRSDEIIYAHICNVFGIVIGHKDETPVCEPNCWITSIRFCLFRIIMDGSVYDIIGIHYRVRCINTYVHARTHCKHTCMKDNFIVYITKRYYVRSPKFSNKLLSTTNVHCE